MKGPEIVAALRGIMHTTQLNSLSPEDKAAIRSLLDIINLGLFPLSSECLKLFQPLAAVGWQKISETWQKISVG